MAVTSEALPRATAGAPVVRPARPGAGVFIRLKLRLLRNGFRAGGWRLALAILGVLGGVWFSFVGFLLFAVSAFLSPRGGFTLAVLGGAGLIVGWVLLPLLMFGVDETLDPARFALLPIRRRAMLRGLFAAALIGVPPVMTLIATQGLVLAAGSRGGGFAALAAFAGTVLGLLLCVSISRAVTSALASALRSRKVRDSAMVLLAVLAAGLWPMQLAGASVLQFIGPDRLAAAARVLAWTPLGAPYAVGPDVAAGRWPEALLRLAISALAVGLLLWGWAAALPAAMRGGAGATARRRGARAAAGAADAVLVPAVLLRLPARFATLMARDLRYWWRDPRRRANLVSGLMGAAVMPAVFVFIGSGGNLPIGLAVAGALTGSLLANQFGFDGSALAVNLLAGVPGRVEIGARVAAASAIVVPALVVSAVVVDAVSGGGRLVAAVGAGIAGYGVSAALATVVSVLLPYPLPESDNPFALGTGAGGLRMLASFVPVLAGSAVAAPLSFAAALLDGWLSLLLGLAVGAGTIFAGVLIAGNALDGRAPEVLTTVTPRR